MRNVFLMSFIALSLCACIAVGAATLGAVTYYKSAKHEVATVNINATPDNIYRVALQTIKRNSLLKVVSQDEKNHLIELTKGDLSASLKVFRVDPQVSQLLITSEINADRSTRLVLDGVFRICQQLKVDCTLVVDGS
ncbi:DUF3568 family protein [Shewanella sp. GutDb-MelDb]|uniref:DUF3568 family protein n=1 Tax=Shewanella sp. GutDb-MelDb TaxID=2058316 RepID=UPI000C7A15EC|nr:DUF3568 family protein [Shewanella sp. GutDb-MelDb]PKG58607.1 DUF3568 domain-containing protein [Shewanella sp. GutDb-MelDb]